MDTKYHTYEILHQIVAETQCFPNWTFRVEYEDAGPDRCVARLVIRIKGHNNYYPDQPFIVDHYHPVPIATYNEQTWRRWIYEQCRRTMNHEIGEALRFGSEDNPIRPFAPMHGPGEDPYTVHEYRPEIDFLTTQNGSIRERPI